MICYSRDHPFTFTFAIVVSALTLTCSSFRLLRTVALDFLLDLLGTGLCYILRFGSELQSLHGCQNIERALFRCRASRRFGVHT